MSHSRAGATMHVMLQRIGLSEAEAAAFLGVDVQTVMAWLTPLSLIGPSEEQWEKLTLMALRQDRAARDTMEYLRQEPGRDWIIAAGTFGDFCEPPLPCRSAYIAALRRVMEMCATEQISCSVADEEQGVAHTLLIILQDPKPISRHLRSGPTIVDRPGS